MKGFKVFNPDWTCRGFQYEVGKVYEENIVPSVCDKGFHFCKEAKDCFNYYGFDPSNKVAEILAIGDVSEEGDKCCTNIIQVIREITWQEVLTIVNIGKACTGLCNSGDCNSGDCNSGDCNSGDCNSGDCNSGNCNSGDCNSGNWNSGNCNSGNWNSGNCNSGDCNSGNCNSGNRNSGNWNSGNRNSGNWNSGNWNSGDWNKSSQTMGCFNTQSQKLKFFDQETDMSFDQWQNSDARYLLNQIDFRPADWIWTDDMTDIEKAEHTEHETTVGYLKIRDNTDCCTEWWNGLSERNKNIVRSIPNFDLDKFFKITGIRI
ncbi:MAG: hypothetical protein PHR06_01250 [Candidatus Cloacimonetes bacterium]|nr:hypothetical protein [Candidatus Cloacimonadota bacterium]